MKEHYTTGTGEAILVHSRKECSVTTDRSLQGCVIHCPTKHHMTTWPTHWRDDRKLMERLCPHGIGHPDPDQIDFDVSQGREHTGVHGCDGCCRKPIGE